MSSRVLHRVLITGITGFVGSHLAEFILANHPSVEIHGLKRWRSPMDNIRHIQERVILHDGDLRDQGSLIRLLEAVTPDAIFHLAAQSFVPTSFDAPVDTLETNVIGTTHLLEAIRVLGQDPLVHVCSSAEVYGQVRPEEVPITEDQPQRPASPYALSKASADMAAFYYWTAFGIRTIRSRMFNHSGARRGPVFVDSAFCLQLARIEAGLQEPVLRVGNLESVRTFCDVRDTARAYWDLITLGEVGAVYNIGGETSLTMAQVLDMVLAQRAEGCPDIAVRVDPALLRPADVTLQVPDIRRFQAISDWRPAIPYAESLRAMLDYWRERVSKGMA